MTWFKCDDTAHDHPKVKALSNHAFRWWFIGLSYASRYLTNGILPKVFWQDVPKQVRAELQDGRLWDWIDPHFQIHDYLEHQTSKEVVSQKRADNAERVMRYRERKRNALHVADGNALVTHPDNREQIQRTEIREELKNTHNAPARANGQSRGANTPGSLPRDHRFHGHCSAHFRLCLSEPTSVKLMGLWGGAPDDSSPVVQEFIDALEVQIGEGPKGDHLWLLQHFEAFMATKGRTPIPAPVKPKQTANGSVAAAIDKWGTE